MKVLSCVEPSMGFHVFVSFTFFTTQQQGVNNAMCILWCCKPGKSNYITGECIILVKFNSRDSTDESSSEQSHSSLLEKIYMYVPQSRIATSNEDYVPRRDRFQFVSWKSNKFPRPARKESAKDSLSNFFHEMYGHFSSPSQRR